MCAPLVDTTASVKVWPICKWPTQPARRRLLDGDLASPPPDAQPRVADLTGSEGQMESSAMALR